MIFVDDMCDFEMGQFRRMKMSHMISDTDDADLHAMADKIGVARLWHQRPPKASHSHYDICKSKRALAIKNGARLVTMRELCEIVDARHAAEAIRAKETTKSTPSIPPT